MRQFIPAACRCDPGEFHVVIPGDGNKDDLFAGGIDPSNDIDIGTACHGDRSFRICSADIDEKCHILDIHIHGTDGFRLGLDRIGIEDPDLLLISFQLLRYGRIEDIIIYYRIHFAFEQGLRLAER